MKSWFRKHKKWSIPLTASIGGLVFAWLHIFFMFRDPDYSGVFDFVYHVSAVSLKIVTLISLPFAFGFVFRRCSRNIRTTLVSVFVWSVTSILLFGILSYHREPLAELLNNGASRFYPISGFDAVDNVSRYKGQHYIDFPEFWRRWESGRIFATEVFALGLCLLALGAVAFFLGRNRFYSGAAAVGLLWFITVVVGLLGKLAILDYDIFYAGTLFGPMSSECIIIVTGELESGIGFLVYSSMIVSSFVLDVILLPNRNDTS